MGSSLLWQARGKEGDPQCVCTFNHGKKKQASCLGERKTQLKVYSVMSGRSWKRGERGKGEMDISLDREREKERRERESKNKRLE